MSFAAARRRAIACSATDSLYAPAFPHRIASRGRRSKGMWSTPATRTWIIRRRGARDAKSGGSSEPKPVQTRISAVSQADPRCEEGTSSRMSGSNAPGALAETTARRSASIEAENRTRGMTDPTTWRDLALSTAAGSTLRVPAGVALHASLFEHEGLAALRAFRVQALPQQLRRVTRLLLQLDVGLDGAAEFVIRCNGRLHAGLLHPDAALDLLRAFDADFRRLLCLHDADVQDLVFPRSVAVHRDALALQIESKEVGLLHVLHGRLPGHVDRLRDSGVGIVLETRLHTHVPLGRNVVGRRENPLPFLWDVLQAARRSVVVEDLLHEVIAPNAIPFCNLLKVV